MEGPDDYLKREAAAPYTTPKKHGDIEVDKVVIKQKDDITVSIDELLRQAMAFASNNPGIQVALKIPSFIHSPLVVMQNDTQESLRQRYDEAFRIPRNDLTRYTSPQSSKDQHTKS